MSRLNPPQNTHRGGPEAAVACFLGGSHACNKVTNSLSLVRAWC